MPKQHRWIIKRNMSQVQNDIDRAILKLVETGHEFDGVHPEYYQAFCLIATNLSKIKDSVFDLSEQI